MGTKAMKPVEGTLEGSRASRGHMPLLGPWCPGTRSWPLTGMASAARPSPDLGDPGLYHRITSLGAVTASVRPASLTPTQQHPNIALPTPRPHSCRDLHLPTCLVSLAGTQQRQRVPWEAACGDPGQEVALAEVPPDPQHGPSLPSHRVATHWQRPGLHSLERTSPAVPHCWSELNLKKPKSAAQRSHDGNGKSWEYLRIPQGKFWEGADPQVLPPPACMSPLEHI